MHITKNIRCVDSFWSFSGYRTEFDYTVFYKGFVARDLDLSAAIARCYEAATN